MEQDPLEQDLVQLERLELQPATDCQRQSQLVKVLECQHCCLVVSQLQSQLLGTECLRQNQSLEKLDRRRAPLCL